MWKPTLERVLMLVAIVFTIATTSTNSLCNRNIRCDPKYLYRSINGSCNNLENPHWAMSKTPYARLLPNNYGDGKYSFPVQLSGNPLKLSREVSNRVNPARTTTDRKYTLGLMQFGQIVAHDWSFTGFGEDFGLPSVQCCSSNQPGPDAENPRCKPILAIPPNDPVHAEVGSRCYNFERTATSRDIGCTGENEVAEPITVVTGYLDLSIVYGPTDDVAQRIRTLTNGKLKAEERHGQTWPQHAEDSASVCNVVDQNIPCYGSGDVRMNQNPQLTLLQTAFLRQHNDLADGLAAINPRWSDEKLYQEARRLNIALYQNIVYKEYAPRIIGESYAESRGILYPPTKNCINDYNPGMDASAIVESASAALRSLHSQIQGSLQLVDEARNVIGEARLTNHTNNAALIENSVATGQCDRNYDFLTRGLGSQPSQKANKYFDEEIKSYLFRGSNRYGIDLRTIDIQRERDHGVGTYRRARQFCGLSVPDTFDDLLEYIPAEDVAALRDVYETVGDISLNSGGLVERPSEGSLVGPTYQCILGHQFYKTRVGDRFFYQNCEFGRFSLGQLREIRKGTFACLLCKNAKCVSSMQPSAFDQISSSNQPQDCSKLCDLDLTKWKETPHRAPTRTG